VNSLKHATAWHILTLGLQGGAKARHCEEKKGYDLEDKTKQERPDETVCSTEIVLPQLSSFHNKTKPLIIT